MGVPREHHLFMIVWSDGITSLMKYYVYEWSDGVTYSPIILCVLLGSLKTSLSEVFFRVHRRLPRCSFEFTENQRCSYRIIRLCVFENTSVLGVLLYRTLMGS